jgi:hypothetical protein
VIAKAPEEPAKKKAPKKASKNDGAITLKK